MKRAQISVFLIIGIVIVISSVIFFVIKSNIDTRSIAPDFSKVVEELPTEFSPIRPIIDKCLEQASREALNILGDRGGYIYTDDLNPPSDSIYFSRGSDLVLPFWHYLSASDTCRGNCEFSSARPGENLIQNQISRYVEENIMTCLDDFKSLKQLGYEVEIKKDPIAATLITTENIRVKLNYPLSFTRQKNKIDVEDFFIILPVNLAKIIKFADYITKLEREYQFLEKSTLNMIVAFSGVDETLLPPMSEAGVEIAASTKWSKIKVKNDLKGLLSTYTPLLRMVDTPSWNEIITDSYYQDKFYNRGMSIPNNSSITDLEIYFDYLSFWDLYFDLNCNGDTCEPQSFFTDILPIGLQRYNFAYDLSYPVLITIHDQKALYGEGYTFKFLLESNIRDNAVLTENYNPITPVSTQTGTMLCNENKKTSGVYTFTVNNALTLEPLDNAQLIYSCIEACNIGQTYLGEYKGALPVCLGGSLVVRKEGFRTANVPLNSFVGKSDQIVVNLFPKKSMIINVIKRVLVKDDDNWVYSHDENLFGYETTIITIDNDEFNIVELEGDTTDTIDVSVGEYSFEVNIISDKEYYIPAKEIHGEEIPEYRTNSIIIASALIDYTFTTTDLDGTSITIYVTSYDLYSIPQDDRKLSDIDVVSKEYNYNLIDVK